MTTPTTKLCCVAFTAHVALFLFLRRLTAIDDCISADCMPGEYLLIDASAGTSALTAFFSIFDAGQDEVGICTSSNAFLDSHVPAGHIMQRVRKGPSCGTLTNAVLVRVVQPSIKGSETHA